VVDALNGTIQWGGMKYSPPPLFLKGGKMKKGSLLFVLFLFAACAFAENENVKRQINPALSFSEMGSLDWSRQVNASAANWTKPDSVKITDICILDSGTVFVDLPNADSIPLYSPDFQCYPVLVKKIYQTSLTISVYGRKNK
jgi:hypothetical protein